MPKTFGMSFYGYNKNEVNDFLPENLRNLLNEVKGRTSGLKKYSE